MSDIINCIKDDVMSILNANFFNNNDIIVNSVCEELDIYIHREIIDDYRVISLKSDEYSIIAEILIILSTEYNDEELITITSYNEKKNA